MDNEAGLIMYDITYDTCHCFCLVFDSVNWRLIFAFALMFQNLFHVIFVLPISRRVWCTYSTSLSAREHLHYHIHFYKLAGALV